MDTKQTEALRLADRIQASGQFTELNALDEAAVELRRLHAESEALRQGYDAARLEIASLHAQMEAVGAGGMEPLRKRCLHQISEPAQPVGAAPVGIVAASPGYVGVGWIGGYVPKHNDKLYAAPQPAAQALDAPRLRQASQDISTVLRVEGMALEIGSRKLLKEARGAIDAAIAAQQGGAHG